MAKRLSGPDHALLIGLTLGGLAALALVSHIFGVTDILVAANCGTAPPRRYAEIDAYFAFRDCQYTIEQRYWNVAIAIAGCSAGYGMHAWSRRKAKQDAQRAKLLDDELARIRADSDRR